MLTLTDFLDFAIDATWQAGQLTLSHFQTDLRVDWKSDHSPVTIADKNAETLLRMLIETKYPQHAIVGEEFGNTDSRDAKYRWIIDPIDGTRSFIRGVPLYAVLLGLEIDGEMVVGVAHFPALDEMVWAGKNLGCRWNGRPAQVSQISQLSEALLCYTDSTSFAKHNRGAVWQVLAEKSHTLRGLPDAYGHILVATGRAEAMFDPIMNVWDCAALQPILQEAGGTFTNWQGQPTIYGEEAISTNGHLLPVLTQLIAEHPG